MKNWLPPNTAIAHYRILSPLGAGGMGEVYLAEDTRLGRKVALKLLSEEFTRNENRVRRFEQEARAASALNHPNILTIHDIGQADGVRYIATEFIEGETLRKRLGGKRMDVHDLLPVGIQIAGALAEAHRAGIVHRDIKPENVMLRTSGLVKVLDFGVAKLTEEAPSPESATLTVKGVDTAYGTVLGTHRYMSPEQARGQKVDARSDIFSLGVVLHEMAAGEAPFQGETTSHVVIAILEKEPPLLSRCAPGIPEDLERIVARALRKNRDDRYQSVKDLHLDLKGLKQELELKAQLERLPERIPERAPGRVQTSASTGSGAALAMKPLSMVMLYKRKADADEQLLRVLEERFTGMGHDVFIDRHLKIGVEWAQAIERRIRAADAVIALLSDASAGSEMLEYELETASDEFRKRGKPRILPVRIGSDKPLGGVAGSVVERLNYCLWRGPEDTGNTISQIASALFEPVKSKSSEVLLEPVGGAVPPASPFYIERRADAEFLQAIRAAESIILIKGPRQMGKTSLLGRGGQMVRESGLRHVTTDFQKISSSQLANEDQFYKLLAATVARQLGVKYDFANEWLDVFGPGMNMDNFIRTILDASPTPLVWFMDEADKLFGIPYASDFFGLIRSWHNSRATDSQGPWARFTVVISYATEAHLFIQDLNQSPFNVGRQIQLQGFDQEQTEELNRRYGAPLASADEVQALRRLVSGQPFLTRRALDTVKRGVMDFADLLNQADRDDGPFGDHLKRILVAVSQLPEVLEALCSSPESPQLRDADGFHRLVSAGVMCQTGDNRITFTCELYRRYFKLHVHG
jgi:serine/threonine protein kinase